jgi:PASTA domain-containing protein
MGRSAAAAFVLIASFWLVAAPPTASGTVTRGAAVQPDARLTLDRGGAGPVTGRGIVVTTGIESHPAPGPSFDFVLTITLPPNLAFVSSTPGQPAAIPCVPAGQTVTCRGRHLGGDISSNVNLTVRSEVPGTYIVGGSLALAGESDADPTNNSASLEFSVAAAPVETACVVPRLRGRPLAQARRSITASGCRIGPISTRHDTRVRRGLVLASRPVAGARLARGSRIAVVVSRGPR